MIKVVKIPVGIFRMTRALVWGGFALDEGQCTFCFCPLFLQTFQKVSFIVSDL